MRRRNSLSRGGLGEGGGGGEDGELQLDPQQERERDNGRFTPRKEPTTKVVIQRKEAHGPCRCDQPFAKGRWSRAQCPVRWQTGRQ